MKKERKYVLFKQKVQGNIIFPELLYKESNTLCCFHFDFY